MMSISLMVIWWYGGDSLYLTLVIETSEVKRTNFINDVNDIENLVVGEYLFIFKNDSLSVYFTNEDIGEEDKRRLDIGDLVAAFEQAAGEQFKDDSLLLSCRDES